MYGEATYPRRWSSGGSGWCATPRLRFVKGEYSPPLHLLFKMSLWIGTRGEIEETCKKPHLKDLLERLRLDSAFRVWTAFLDRLTVMGEPPAEKLQGCCLVEGGTRIAGVYRTYRPGGQPSITVYLALALRRCWIQHSCPV